MLEQLEKVDGVESAMANHTGSMVRVSLTPDGDAFAVTEEMNTILKKQGRKPKQLNGDEVANAINDQKWRVADKVNELSEIEFRTVFERRVKQFVESEELDKQTKEKLLSYAQQILDEKPETTSETDWVEYCGSLAARMLERAKEVLNDEQIESLRKKLKASVIG